MTSLQSSEDLENHEQGNYNAQERQRGLRRKREGHGPGEYENSKEVDASGEERVRGEPQ